MVFKIALLALCLGWLAKIIIDLGPGAVFAAAREAELVWLLAAVVPLWLRFALWAWKWRLLTDHGPQVGTRYLFGLVMSGCLVNLATPTAKLGGGVFRAWILHRKKGLRRSHAFGWVLADQLTTALGTMFLFSILAFAATFLFSEREIRMTAWIVGGVFIITALLWLWGRPRLWRKVLAGDPFPIIRKLTPPFLRKSAGQPDGEWVAAFLEPSLAPKPFWWSVGVEILLPLLSFLCLCWSNALVLKALGTHLTVVEVFVAVSLGYVLGSMLGIMGGIGVTEVFLIQLFTKFGMTPELAASGALIHRAFYYGFILILGGWASLMFKREPSVNRAKTDASSSSEPDLD